MYFILLEIWIVETILLSWNPPFTFSLDTSNVTGDIQLRFRKDDLNSNKLVDDESSNTVIMSLTIMGGK